jgi:endoglucanase
MRHLSRSGSSRTRVGRGADTRPAALALAALLISCLKTVPSGPSVGGKPEGERPPVDPLPSTMLLPSRKPAVGWLRANGPQIVGDDAKPVRLAGLVLSNNVWGVWVNGRSDALKASGTDPMIHTDRLQPWVLTDYDLSTLERLPIQVVRYDFNYELFASENRHRLDNAAQIAAHVRHLGQAGIYTILDLMVPPGLGVSSDNWERRKPGRERQKSIFEDDALLDRAKEMWAFVARQFASLPELAAYELINEPRLPCSADGGMVRYQAAYRSLVEAIRSVDQRHLILVPEYHSREANPGEAYTDDATKASKIDSGEQGVLWDHGLVKVEDANVAYVFHFYEPWEYVAEGARSYDGEQVKSRLDQRLVWQREIGRAPFFVTEYGVNRNQPADKRKAWLDFVHGLFVENGISSTYYCYKSEVGPWIKPSDNFAIFGQYVGRLQHGKLTAEGYQLQPWAVAPAHDNGFDRLLDAYFRSLTAKDLSLMDSAPLLEALTALETAL